jgi:DNA-binding NarL/FixJ family response regulator
MTFAPEIETLRSGAADKLFLSFETIRGYHKDLYVKLDAHSTRELIIKAEGAGLV